jgi:hypothetical protein
MLPFFGPTFRLVEWSSPNPDDTAALSTLYPSSTFAGTTGTIKGRIRYADGVGFMGANVIARKVEDPLVTAFSSVSGFQHIGSVPNEFKEFYLQSVGRDDADSLGYYEIRGLAPGNYTVEIEAINSLFISGGRVGPLDPPATLPGPAEFYSGNIESDRDPPSSKATVNVAAGATVENIDIVLNADVNRPANDECGKATAISNFPFSTRITAYQATSADNDPGQSCSFGRGNSNSVWYSFTPTSNGTVTVNTFSSRYDTVVSLYNGSCPAVRMAEVACNDDASGGEQSQFRAAVTAGMPYLLEVTNLGGPIGRTFDAQLVLNVSFTAAAGGESLTDMLKAQDDLSAQADSVQENESNNSISSANSITPNVTVIGTLDPAGDSDFFGFNATQGQQLTIDINAQSISPASGIDTVVTLFDSSGRQVAENDDGPGSTLDSFLQFTIPTTGRYFFRVRDFSARGGRNFNYQAVVKLSGGGGGGNTVNEAEPNNAITQANLIVPNVTVAGVLSQNGDADFFAFDATQGQRLTVDVDAQSLTPKSSADPEITLFDSNGRQIAENEDESSSNRDPLLQFTLPSAGRYFFRIRDESNRGGSSFNYLARVTLTGGTQPPPGSVNESEPNNSLNQADSITPNVTVRGTLDPNGDVDFFSFNATAGQRVKIDIDAQSLTPPSTADTIVELFDGQGNKLAVNDDEASNRLDSLLEFTFTTSGRFIFSVRDFSNKGGSSFIYQAVVTLTGGGGGGGGRVNESEPNNTRQQADSITPDVTAVGTLDSANDVDFFGFDARSGQRLRVDINAQSLTPSSDADTVVTLFDNNGNQLAENDDASNSLDSLLDFTITSTGRYFIRVRNFSTKGGQTFTYEAVVTLTGGTTPPPGPGTVNETESNNSIQQANFVTPNVTIIGTVNPGGDADFFGFDATRGQPLTIDINAASLSPASALDSVVTLFDSNGNQLTQNDDSGGSVDSLIQFTIPANGRYFFSVRNFDSKGGPNFNYQAVVTLGGGGGGGNTVNESEPNNNRQQANSITPDVTVQGIIGFFNDVDFFSFNGRAGQRVTLDVNTDSGGFNPPDTLLTLFDNDGNQIAENNDDPRGGTRDSFLQFTLPRTGQYFFSLRDARGFGSTSFDYEIQVSLTRVSGGDAEEFEPNNTFAQANPITENSTISATINPSGDVDIFSFDGRQGQLVIIDIDAESLNPSSPADLKAELFFGGLKLLEADNSLSSRDPFLVFVVAVEGKYSVRVTEVSGRGGANFEYKLSLR